MEGFSILLAALTATAPADWQITADHSWEDTPQEQWDQRAKPLCGNDVNHVVHLTGPHGITAQIEFDQLDWVHVRGCLSWQAPVEDEVAGLALINRNYEAARVAFRAERDIEEEALALGFSTVAEMWQHQAWLDKHGTPEYRRGKAARLHQPPVRVR